MINKKNGEEKYHDLNEESPQDFLSGKSIKNLSQEASASAEIQTMHPLNKCLEHYSYTNWLKYY
jgi:hypothetical protein